MIDLFLRQWQAPGDLLVLTVALRDLQLSYPDTYRVHVHSCYPEVFYNNSDIASTNASPMCVDVLYNKWRMDLLNCGNHFSDAFIFELNNIFNLSIKKTSMYPEIHLTDEERDPRYLSKFGVIKPYWVINAGTKLDIPLKQYPPFYWQNVVNQLNFEKNRFGIPLVQAGHDHDIQPPLEGVKNLIGKTNNLRDYFALVYHSEGSMGHISLHMHVAAAFGKPCVVVAGGREGFRWEMYPGHQYLHVTGLLNCAGLNGCWKSKLSECKNKKDHLPMCYFMIPSNEVVKAVLKYYCAFPRNGV